MKELELKVPPVAVASAVALAMWGLAHSLALPMLRYSLPGWAALALVAAGVGVGLAGVVAFRRSSTTVDPTRPASASTVVTGGIYRFSRNPMYLGLLLGLAGWAAHLGNLSCFVLLPVFVCYITRFQIMPEELALASKFGRDFDTYCRSVRRWF